MEKQIRVFWGVRTSKLLPSILLTSIVLQMALMQLVRAQTEVLIPRSMPGDKGKYYLLAIEKRGDFVKALHKRVGVESVGFTRTETNCKTRKMREWGYSEKSANDIKMKPSLWFDLVPGSSKNDLAQFVCK